jgi:hypothetical protein
MQRRLHVHLESCWGRHHTGDLRDRPASIEAGAYAFGRPGVLDIVFVDRVLSVIIVEVVLVVSQSFMSDKQVT